MAEHRVDLEELAALADGRLRGDARDRVVKLLAESGEAYEILAETVRFREEAALAERKVVPLSAGRRWARVVVPLAVAATVVLILGQSRLLRRSGAPTAAGAELVAPFGTQRQLASRLGPDWDRRTWSATRGGPGRLVEREAAFRLGVRSVDLSLALRLGDAQEADRLASEMVELLSGVEMSQAVMAQYAELQTRAAAGDVSAPVAAGASRAEGALRELLGTSRFDLGQWCAAAELAARARNVEFFHSRLATGFLDVVDRQGLDTADARALARVAELAHGAITEAEFSELHELLRTIIRRNAG